MYIFFTVLFSLYDSGDRSGVFKSRIKPYRFTNTPIHGLHLLASCLGEVGKTIRLYSRFENAWICFAQARGKNNVLAENVGCLN